MHPMARQANEVSAIARLPVFQEPVQFRRIHTASAVDGHFLRRKRYTKALVIRPPIALNHVDLGFGQKALEDLDRRRNSELPQLSRDQQSGDVEAQSEP